MSQITEGLTTKIGPAPAWVYGVGLGVVIIVVRAHKARKSSPVPAAPASDGASTAGTGANPSPTAGGSTPSSIGGYVIPTGYQSAPANYGGTIDYNGNTTTGTSPNNAPTNVDDWSNQAYSHLIGHGYAALAATEALRKYLAGEPVTSSEEGMIAVALREVGPVPGGAPALTRATTTTGATVPATAPSSATPPAQAPAPASIPPPRPAQDAPQAVHTIYGNPTYSDYRAAALWQLKVQSLPGQGTDTQRAQAYQDWANEINRLRSIGEYDDRYDINHGPPYAPGERSGANP